jgi:hypothetical protein
VHTVTTKINAPVEIVEKREKVEAKLAENLFFVSFERSEYLSRVIHVVLVDDSVKIMNETPSSTTRDALVCIIDQKRCI